MKHLGSTPPFRGPGGRPSPDSIAQVEYLRLGGVEQWVMMRGESRANPPLILLHGGPGLSESMVFRHFNAALEKDFTVIYWDQRAAGKSYSWKIPRESMTVEQFVADLGQLVDVVRRRLGHEKVALYGHSWGSALGVLYAFRFPEKVAAYVGSGQIGDSAVGESLSYAFALSEAQRLGEDRLVGKLRAIGPPPYKSARAVTTERMALLRVEGQGSVKTFWDLGRIMLGGPESSLIDLPNILRGFRFSLEAMWDQVSRLNVVELAPGLQMPVFFFLGRNDHWVPPEASLAYFDALAAPSKELLWFETSGHEPFIDEPVKFTRAMAELVRPVLV